MSTCSSNSPKPLSLIAQASLTILTSMAYQPDRWLESTNNNIKMLRKIMEWTLTTLNGINVPK